MPTLCTLYTDIKKSPLVSTAKDANTMIPGDTAAPAPISTIHSQGAPGTFNHVEEAAALPITDRKRPLSPHSSSDKPKKRAITASTPHGSGPWSHEENVAFRRACLIHGIGNWTNISKMIPSRTAAQVKSHAQKMKIHQAVAWNELVKRSETGMILSNLAWLDEFAGSNPRVATSKADETDVNHRPSKPHNMTAEQGFTELHRTKDSKSFKPRAATKTWTKSEHLAFCRACCIHGVGNWKNVSELVPTRSAIQVKSHAQKVKLHRPEEWRMLELGIFEEVEHKEGRDDEKRGDKFMEDRTAAVDPQLETAGNLLLLASGDGDNHDFWGGTLPTGISKEECHKETNRDCREECCPSRVKSPPLVKQQKVCISQAISSSNANSSEMKYSMNEAHRIRSVMGYDATMLFGKEIATSNNGSSAVVSNGVKPALSMKCEASSDKIRQKSPKKCEEETEPKTSRRESDNSDCDTNGNLSPNEKDAAIDLVVLSNETHLLRKNAAKSAGACIDSKDAPQDGTASSSPTTKHSIPSLLTLRAILSTLNASELLQIMPSKDHQIYLLQKENESLKATIEKLQLKLAMEKRRNDLKGNQAVNGTRQDASFRAGLSALKARDKKA